MIFDYLAALDAQKELPQGTGVDNLSSSLVDFATVRAARPDGDASDDGGWRAYAEAVSKCSLGLPASLSLHPTRSPLLSSWLAIELTFSLLTPWYSKDDRPFHVLDNPLRKDRVFGVPFMSAASWKGLLRWACRMEHGLLAHLAAHDGKMRDWDDPDWIVHLFGNARGDGEEFSRGALHCYPTWFDKVGFEVINPHERARRAGTQPITYEVVPPGTAGTLRLLYAPVPDAAEGVQARMRSIETLLDAIEKLLTVYGFSAKRTAGWGISKTDQCTVRCRDRGPIQGDLRTVKSRLSELFSRPEGAG